MNDKKLEVVAEECLEELMGRSLILVGSRRPNGRIKTCVIHDLLRQLCLREAQTENVMHIIDASLLIFSLVINDQRRVMSYPEVSLEFVIHPRLWSGAKSPTRSLLLLRHMQGPFPFVSRLKLLKVLDVISVRHAFCSVIPQLVHLSYVAANIKTSLPPSLSNLWNLQTLILCVLYKDGRENFHLPLEIWTMSQIRHIDIGYLIHMPSPLEAESHNIAEQPLFLNNLQTLVLKCSGIGTKEILRRTPNLNKLSICWESCGSELSALLDCLIHLHGLETLRIEGASLSHRISFMDVFPPNVKQLRISWIRLPWEAMIVLVKISNLEVLKIDSDFYDGTDWILNDEVVFQKLKFLRISSFNLKRWEATSDNFPLLEQLVLINCFKLKEIPLGFGEITTLQLIKLECCNPATEASAKEIQEEQKSCGNYGLQVLIKSRNLDEVDDNFQQSKTFFKPGSSITSRWCR